MLPLEGPQPMSLLRTLVLGMDVELVYHLSGYIYVNKYPATERANKRVD